MTAFLSYVDAKCLEHCSSVGLMPFSVTYAVTSGIQSLIGKPRKSSTELSAPEVGRTLADGRMKVGVDLPLLSRRFRYLRLLGEGMSAQVILAEDTSGQKTKVVVIKVLKRHFGTVGQKEACALRFLQGRNAAPHGGLVKLSSAFTYCGHVCLVLERLHGSLLDYVVHSASLCKPQALQNLRKIAVQLLGTLALMHSKGVVHADIKPENILMTSPVETGRVGLKLIDLGNCFSVTGTDTSRISFEMQSLAFRAPEALLGEACGTGIDVWSLGCLLAEVALQRPLFPVMTTAELMQQMTMQLGPFPTVLAAQFSPQDCTHTLPSRVRGPDACCPAVKPTSLSQQQQGRASRPRQPAKEQATPGSLRPRTGNLSLLHESACPLHVELARVNPAMASLVMAMLRYSPEQRVSAGEALSHPFLSEVSPVLSLLTAKQGAAGAQPQGRVMGSTDTQAQGTFQQGCQAEAFAGQTAGTLRPALPFKPEPRRQPIVSLPTPSRPAAQAAVLSWGIGRLPMPSDPLQQAAQPQLQVAQPQLRAAQPQPQAAQPQPQAAQPQPQAAQPQLQLLQGIRQPLPGQGPLTSLPNRSPGMTASALPATASANPHPPTIALATARHNPPEVTAHQDSCWDGQRPAVMPAVVPAAGPSPDKAAPGVASSVAAACTLPTQKADPPSASPSPALGASATTPKQTATPNQPRASAHPLEAEALGQDSFRGVALGSLAGLGGSAQRVQGQGEYSAEEALHSDKVAEQQGAGLGGVATPQALAQGSVKTPGLVKAWKGVTELLQQMSPSSQVKPAPRSLSQALQAAHPSATPHTHTPASPPHARHPLLCPTAQQPQQLPTQQQLPVLQTQPRRQQQEQQLPLLQIQRRQQQEQLLVPKPVPQTESKHQQKQSQGPMPVSQTQPKQQQGRLQVQPQAECPEHALASVPTSHAGPSSAATASERQQAEARLDRQSCVSTEAGQGMLTLSDQSHVSASPSRSRGWSDRQAASQQQQRLGQAETTADSAAQSSYGTGLSQGCSGSELGTKQPVLHGLTGQAEGAEAAAVACGQGLPGAALATAEPQKRGAGEGLTRAGALPAALEPAGPVAGTQSGGTVPFASVDKAQQSWQQQPKHKTHVSQGRVQKTKRKSTAPLPGDQAPERRPKLATAAVRVAEQKSRNVSHEASAVPAESQQSAVHAEHSASTHRHKHAQRAARTSKDSMGDAAGERSHCDGRRSSSRAKQARAEAAVCCAYVKDVGQSRMHGGNHLNSMPAVSPINQWGGQTRGTGRIGMYQSNACESVDRAERLHEGAADDHTHVGRAPHIQHTPEGSSGMGSESISHGRAGQAAKRSSRNRDGEANKPWWVV